MTIDGVEVLNTSNTGTQFIGVSVHTAADVTIENSVFFSTGPNGTNEDRAINLDTTAQGHVVIANNLVTGDATGQFSTASWHRGIWSDGAASQLDVTGNTFENVRSGMNLDGYDDAHTNVSGNTFANGGTAIAIGTPVTSAITGIHDNTFKDVADDFNLKNVDAAHPQTFDADATHNIAVASGGDSVGVLHVLGTLGADTLTGTAGVDVLDAADLPDGIHDSASNTLHGLGGDDILLGSDGNDTLDGGAGNDTLVGGAGNDTAVYTAVVDSSNITDDGSHFVVAAGGSEGTDTLSGIEKIGGAGAPNILLVGHGGYSSIQAAVDAAVDGDIIEIAAGTWTEDVAVHGKAITIDGVSGVNDVILNGKITVDGTLNGAVQGHRSQYRCDRQGLRCLRLGQLGRLWRLGDARRRVDRARPEQRLRLHPRRQRIISDAGRYDRRGVDPQQPVQRQRDHEHRWRRPRRHPAVRIQPGSRPSPTSTSARPAPSRRRRSRCAASRTAATSPTSAPTIRPATWRSTT